MAKEIDKSKPSSKKSATDSHTKKKGFSVGPNNLPDGTYRRKGNDEILQ